MKKIDLPFKKEIIEGLKAGDKILLSGYVYTARDAAHKRLTELIKLKEKLPINLKREVIYYVGPTPSPPGIIIGASGPTTSVRMDPYMKDLLSLGLKATIGKGDRTKEVKVLMKKFKALYFVTFGGAGAYLSAHIEKKELIAYEDLGPEAIYRLYLREFPVILAQDIDGNSIFGK